MYNRLSLIGLIFLGTLTCAQAQNKIESTGNVGIGTTNPTHQLEVLSPAISGAETMFKISVSDAPNDFLSFTNGTGVSGTYIPFIRARFTSDNRPALFLRGQITSATDNGGWAVTIFDALSDNSYVQNRNLFAWRNFTTELMTMSVEGNLGIGTKNPTQKLEVNGNIRAHEIKLETGNWPDYVFKDGYPIKSLEEVEGFIQENHHLPDIPSEKEVLENGCKAFTED